MDENQPKLKVSTTFESLKSKASNLLSPTGSSKEPPASDFDSKPPASNLKPPASTEPPPLIANCPPCPKMGGLQILGSGTSQYAIAWTGGAPNATWTGLDDPSTIITNPRQSRSTSPKATSAHVSRQAGLFPYEEAQKFKSGDDIEFFIKRLKSAFLDMGMDTIGYRHDPLDDTKMIDVLTAYPRLNKETMEPDSLWCLARYDSYDKQNDLQAKKFLLASLSASLMMTVESKIDDDSLFVDVFFTFVEAERPQTVDGSQALVEIVRNMSPRDPEYPNQNISLFVAAIRPKLKHLTAGRLWDSMNNVALCRILACAGSYSDGGSNPEYSNSLFDMHTKLQTACKLITHLANKEKAAYMNKKNLGWDDILKLAETQYLSQMVATRVRWPPACNAKDSKAPPGAFGSANLTQFTPSNGGSNYNRGSTNASNGGGHSGGHNGKGKGNSNKRHGNGNGNGNGTRSNGNGNGDGNGTRTKTKNPKFAPPDGNATPNRHINGIPVFQKMINDRKMEWCSKCNRWSTTHNTATHTGKSGGHSGGQSGGRGRGSDRQAHASFGLIPDPSLWLAAFDDPRPLPTASCFDPAVAPTPTWHSLGLDLITLIGPHMVSALFFGFISLVVNYQEPILQGFSWLGTFTLGELFNQLVVAAAPLLWFCLVFASLFGRSLLYKYDAQTALAATLPFQDRRTRRFYDKQYATARTKFFRRQTQRSQSLYKNRNRQVDQFYTKLGCDLHHRLHPSDSHDEFPGFSDNARRFQEVRTARRNRCKHLPDQSGNFRRARYRKSRNQRRRDGKRYRASRPRRLDLTDPIFRTGLGTKMRHHVNHIHNHFSGSPTRFTTASATPDSFENFNFIRVPGSATKPEVPVSAPSVPPTHLSYFGESVVLQHPLACAAAMDKEDTFTIVWDSGASMCVSFDKNDFVGKLHSLPKGSQIRGIANNLRIEGYGHVVWSVMNTKGMLRHLKLPCYYIPKLKQRLLSTSIFTKTYPDNPITMSSGSWTVSNNAANPAEGGIDVFVSPANNLPISTCFRYNGLQDAAANYTESVSATHAQNHNLSEPQKELLRWHYRLGHIGLRTIQFILRTGVLASSASMRRLHTAAARIPPHDLPKCAACQFGRQTSRPVPGKVHKTVKDRAGILSADKFAPGQQVFIDHFVCSTRGRRIRGYGIRDPSGKSPARSKKDSYSGGCMFVDASTGFVHVEFQTHLNSNETIQAVTNFEALARDNGIIINGYSSDNGSAFTSKDFKTHLEAQGQTATHSGAGSHHQNGKVERCIRTIMAMSRTMLLHAAIHWPDMADPTLWALAVRHSVWIYNHIPNISTGLSPIDLWTRSRFPLRKLHDLHVWGSPAYVLQKRLADGKSVGRWEPRSQRCVNVGFSALHSKEVPYVLNPSTGSITPQWNITFDDYFSTVSSNDVALPDFDTEEWSRLFGTTTQHFPADWDDHDADLEEPRPTTATPQMIRSESIADAAPNVPLPIWPSTRASPKEELLPRHAPSLEERPSFTPSPVRSSTPMEEPRSVPTVSRYSGPSAQPLQEEMIRVQAVPAHVKSEPQSQSQSQSQSQLQPQPQPQPQPRSPSGELRRIADYNHSSLTDTPIRAKRERKKPQNLSYDSLGGLALDTSLLRFFFASGLASDSPIIQAFQAAKKKNPDTLSYDEAMRDTARLQEWLDASLKEIRQLEDKNCWEECLISDANGEPVVPCTWVFRVKRNPAGDIIKCKGRICLRGDLMDDDEESFAPVCAWSSVRLFLVIAMILGWTTVSVDWANAFIQALLKQPMYMATPRGFKNKFGQAGCVRLHRSLYGSKYAPRNWYMHLRQALLNELNMKESPIDPCLLYRDNLIMVLYVDDAGLAAPDRSIIDAFVQELKDLNFDLDIEDDFNSYLGIGIEEFPDGSRCMTQAGLIKKIVKTTEMEDSNPNWTPTTQVALGSDPEGKPFDQHPFNYASVVGMLLYLSNNTRPDITFAVSQVARFTASPKQSHATAIKSIVRYLVRTADKGIIVKPDGTYNLRTWVDADFSGLHNREPESNSASAKSRYGYIITFAGVPLIWKSQLISEICLSTLHAEYVGLVSALRALIPLRGQIVDLLSFLNLPSANPEIHCDIFEDNQGAYLLATNQRLSTRTKYFNVKHHFFWSYVYNEESNPDIWLVIIKCSTDLMNADYLTKGLVRTVFEANRIRVQGW